MNPAQAVLMGHQIQGLFALHQSQCPMGKRLVGCHMTYLLDQSDSLILRQIPRVQGS